MLAAIPEGVEPELLEIFLEEANEVLATMGEASDACQSNPDDQASLTVIRRGFHTLKGSGRMVGLNELGETAWRLEQLMNGWLAEKKPASSDLLRLIGRARGVFQDWVGRAAGQSARGACRCPLCWPRLTAWHRDNRWMRTGAGGCGGRAPCAGSGRNRGWVVRNGGGDRRCSRSCR